jgi:hypothetical protein
MRHWRTISWASFSMPATTACCSTYTYKGKGEREYVCVVGSANRLSA